MGCDDWMSLVLAIPTDRIWSFAALTSQPGAFFGESERHCHP